MADQRILIVGIEDFGTAGVVAAHAAHVAIEQQATQLILLHVLDEHTVVSGMYALAIPTTTMAETAEEGRRVQVLAEAALRAEFAALSEVAPTIKALVVDGPPGAALAEVAALPGVVGVVLGARRPHAFGRLAHPDVRGHVQRHVHVPIFLAPLQAPKQEDELPLPQAE